VAPLETDPDHRGSHVGAYWIDGPSAAERLERTVARDGEASRAHLAAWQQFEDGWFAVDETRDRCRVLGSAEL
jgi:hypothetical protein